MKNAKSRAAFCLIACSVAYTSIYIGRLNLSIANPMMVSSGIATEAQIGLMGSMFFYTYGAGQLINGFLGDKFSSKYLIIIGLLGSAAANISVSFMPHVFVMMALWAINGYAQSMLWGPTLRIVSDTAVPEKMNFSVMVLSATVAVGSAAGTAIGLVFHRFGIETIFQLPGIIILLASIPVFFLPRQKKEAALRRNHLSFSGLLRDESIRRMILPSAAHGVIKESISLWVPVLFMQSYDLDMDSAAIYIFLVPLTSIVGRLVFPLFIKMFGGNEMKTIAALFATCIIALIPLIFFKPGVYAGVSFICIISIFISAMNTAVTSVFPLRFKSSDNVSSVTGLLDCITYLGAGVGSSLLGAAISKLGFVSMFVLWGVLSFASIGSLMIKRQKQIPSSSTAAQAEQIAAD